MKSKFQKRTNLMLNFICDQEHILTCFTFILCIDVNRFLKFLYAELIFVNM